MATKVFMEALSPTMEEGRLVKWNKNEGDAVKSGDSLAEVETDKAIMELVARGDGILRKRLIGEGESRPVGTLLGVIGTADEDINALVASAGAGAPAPSATQPAAAPAQQSASKAPTSSAATEPPTEKPVAASAPPPANSVAAPAARGGNGQQAAQPAQASGQSDGGPVRSSPLARRMAREKGVELSGVAGSGPGGRIIKRDIEGAMAGGGKPAAASSGAAPAMKPRVQREGDFQDVPLTQIRKTIAKRLSESLGPIPTFYLT